jgi:hypothetical protein
MSSILDPVGVIAGAYIVCCLLRPMRDFYVVQRRYFERLYDDPWRGHELAVYHHGFDEYLAAKAFFDKYELDYIRGLDDGVQEAEHSLVVVAARTKISAVNYLSSGKAHRTESVHKTPHSDILKRRKFWQAQRVAAEAE